MSGLYSKICSRIDDVRLLDFLCSAVGYLNNHNVRKIISELSKVDSIEQFDEFVQLIEPIVDNKKMIKLLYPNSESEIYGHIRILESYAGIPHKKRPTFCIEHGINFTESPVSDYKMSFSTLCLFQSDYKKQQIKAIDSSMPVVAIGPYIRYAESYYNETTLRTLKAKYGKTILVFMSHTYEGTSIERDYEIYYEKLIKPFINDFDTIMVCLYWADCKKDFIEKLESYKKVKCVSAGFRYDPYFLNRQRSMLLLADKVIGNDIGTFVGYTMAMGKEFEYVECNDKRVNTKLTFKSFSKEEMIEAFSNHNENLINKIYSYYWNSGITKSPDEIKAIFDLDENINRKSNYKKSRYSSNR